MNENAPLSEASADHLMTVHPSGGIGAGMPAAWPSTSYEAGTPGSAKDLGHILYALRRNWLAATGLGLVCAAVFGMTTYMVRAPQYTAFAQLRLLPSNPQILIRADQRGRVGRPVLKSIRTPSNRLLREPFRPHGGPPQSQPQRPLVHCPRGTTAQYAGLADRRVAGGISVQNAEIMQVSLTGSDPHEAATVVNAVIQAYFEEVVNVERIQRKARLNELQQAYGEKENEVRTKLNELKEMADKLGISDTEAISLKQQMAVQQSAEYGRELTRLKFELSRARGQLQANQAAMGGSPPPRSPRSRSPCWPTTIPNTGSWPNVPFIATCSSSRTRPTWSPAPVRRLRGQVPTGHRHRPGPVRGIAERAPREDPQLQTGRGREGNSEVGDRDRHLL